MDLHSYDLQNLICDFLVQRHVSGKIFMKIRSAVLCEVGNRQTDRQTEGRQVKHTVLDGGN